MQSHSISDNLLRIGEIRRWFNKGNVVYPTSERQSLQTVQTQRLVSMSIRRRNSMDEENEQSVELRDVPVVEVKDPTAHEEEIDDELSIPDVIDSLSVDKAKPLTTGFLNDYFYQQNDVFEKNNHADLL